MKIATQPGVNPLDTLSAHTENIARASRGQSRRVGAAARDFGIRHLALPCVSDGYHKLNTVGGSWDTLIDTASSDSVRAADNTFWVRLASDSVTDQWDDLYRAFAYWDLRGFMRAESIVREARLVVRVQDRPSNDFSSSLVLCAAPAADPPPPVSADFNDYGSVEFGKARLAFSDFTAAEPKTAFFNLNDEGIAHIDTTGHFGFGFKIDHDFDDVEPTWVSVDSSSIEIQTLDDAKPCWLELVYHY